MSLAQPDAARDFLRYYLPAEIVALFDPDAPPELMRDSFVDPELREHLSDLLYRVQLRNRCDAYVYALVEHKSYPFPEVAFQLLRYMVQAWEMLRRQYGMLVPIVPIVVYHGAVTWKQGDRLHDLFVDLPQALQPYTPDFRYWLCDLAATWSRSDVASSVTWLQPMVTRRTWRS